MADDNTLEVKETGSVEPSEEETDEEETEEGEADASQSKEGADDSEETEPEEGEELDEPEAKAPTIIKKPADQSAGKAEPKPVPGETPRERALRLALAEERKKNSGGTDAKTLVAVEKALSVPAGDLSPEQKAFLGTFKPAELENFKKLFSIMATQEGYVKKDQVGQTTYQEKAQDSIDSFLDDHPEYKPENDPGQVLWGRLQSEFKTFYKAPANPKDLKKVLERIHKDVMGIESAAPLSKTNAAKSKVEVASHSSASRPTAKSAAPKRAGTGSALRLDKLQGFTEEQLAEIEAGAEGN